MRRLREEAPREPGAQQIAGDLVGDLRLQPRLEGDRVELCRIGVLPRRLRVELLGERVELVVGLLVGSLGGGPERCVVARVAVASPAASM